MHIYYKRMSVHLCVALPPSADSPNMCPSLGMRPMSGSQTLKGSFDESSFLHRRRKLSSSWWSCASSGDHAAVNTDDAKPGTKIRGGCGCGSVAALSDSDSVPVAGAATRGAGGPHKIGPKACPESEGRSRRLSDQIRPDAQNSTRADDISTATSGGARLVVCGPEPTGARPADSGPETSAP